MNDRHVEDPQHVVTVNRKESAGASEDGDPSLMDDISGLKPHERGDALCRRGILRYHQGQFERALADLREASGLLASVHGSTSPITAASDVYLARVMVALDDVEAGHRLGRTALAILVASVSGDDEILAEACFLLSQAEYQLRNLDEAEALTRRALAIWKRCQGHENLSVSTCLNNLGRIYEERGLLAEGIAFHSESLRIRLAVLGEHEETAFSMGNLGTALAMDQQWEEAARVLQECVDCYARLGVSDGFKVEGFKRNLEVCRRAL